MQATWEVMADGKAATVGTQGKARSPNISGVIMQKITGISHVRAVFAGHGVGFEPYVKLRLKARQKLTGYTLLLASYPQINETGDPASPNVCVRRCEWDATSSIRDFQAAVRKRQYVLASPGLVCAIRFFRAAHDGSLVQLMEETTAALQGGSRSNLVTVQNIGWTTSMSFSAMVKYLLIFRSFRNLIVAMSWSHSVGNGNGFLLHSWLNEAKCRMTGVTSSTRNLFGSESIDIVLAR
jgi:hypothetical protein